MKLLIILSVVVCSYAAKLDRTYLPPASAASAGGSPDSLTAPLGSDQLGSSGLSQPSGPSAFNQASGSGFGETAFGKSVPNFGQQPTSSVKSGSVPSGISESSGPGLENSPTGYQTPSFQYRQSSEGFGQTKPAGSTFSQSPSFGQSAQGFGEASSSFGLQEENAYSAQRYQPERARASLERNAEILRYDNQNDGESFAYSFETSNGISAEESGVASNGVQAQGGFSYTDDDGQVIRVTYTADENGYQPQGDHLPTPPPIPDEILRSIEENARAAAAGVQEGAYNPNEDETGFEAQQYSTGPVQSYQAQGSASRQTGDYKQSQGPQKFDAPSTGSASNQARPITDSSRFQGFNQLNQYKPGFSQNEQIDRSQPGQSGYRYNKPQTSASFGRQLTPSSQGQARQLTPESSGPQFNDAQQSFPTGQRPTLVSNNGQGSLTGPSAQLPENNKLRQPQGSQSFPSSSQGFAPASGSGNQRAAGSSAQGNGQYEPSKPSGSRSSMPKSGPYQYNRPGQQPDVQQPGPQRSGLQRPGSQQPGSQQPGFQQPGSQQPGFQRPESQQPGSQQPGFQQPGFQQPGYQQPGSQQPGFQRPESQQPRSQQPGFQQPGFQQPGFQRPESQRPGSQQPGSQQRDFKNTPFNQGKSGQTFGAPRQPPSFSPEEGYKY